MKALLRGDPQIRPAISEEDSLLEEAAAYDWFFTRYHWTWRDVEDCPEYLKHRLPTVGAIKDEIQNERNEKASLAQKREQQQAQAGRR